MISYEKKFLIVGLIFFGVIIFSIYLGSPDFIILGVIIGILTLLLILLYGLNKFFPENKISKKLGKLIDVIIDFLI